jgi:hypothetical protein
MFSEVFIYFCWATYLIKSASNTHLFILFSYFKLSQSKWILSVKIIEQLIFLNSSWIRMIRRPPIRCGSTIISDRFMVFAAHCSVVFTKYFFTLILIFICSNIVLKYIVINQMTFLINVWRFFKIFNFF